MNNDFKRKLYNEYYDISADFAKIENEKEYERLIANGVQAEQGDDFYIFLYNSETGQAHLPGYESLVILYNRFDPVNPIDIHFSDPNLKYEIHDKLIRTAVYFLRNKLDNTIDKETDLTKTKAHSFAARHIRDHTAALKSLAQRCDELMEKGIDTTVTVETEKIKLPKNRAKRGLPENLGKIFPDAVVNESPVQAEKKKTKTRRRARALAGLCLDIQTNPPQMHFIPIVVPVLRRGGAGKPRKATRSLMEMYKVDTAGLPETVKRFLHHFVSISAEKLYDPLKISLIDSVFFPLLLDELPALPQGRAFYYIDRGNPEAGKTKYLPLEKSNIAKLSLRFAPSLTNREQIEILLTVQDDAKKFYNAGNRYHIKWAHDQAYVFFKGAGKKGFIAAPDYQNKDDERLIRVLRFLSDYKSFDSRMFWDVSTWLEQAASLRVRFIRGDLKKYRLHFSPLPVLKLIEANPITGTGERLKLEFDYHTPFEDFIKNHPQLEPVYSENGKDPQNREFERLCMHMLNDDQMLEMEKPGLNWEASEGCRFGFTDYSAMQWLTTSGKAYLEKGFQLFSQRWNRPIGNVGGTLNISLNNNMNWLEFKPTLTHPQTGKEIDIREIDLEQGVLIDKNQNLHLVTANDIERLKQLNDAAEYFNQGFRIPSDNFMLIDQLYDERWKDFPGLNAKREMARLLSNLKEIPEYSLSPLFNGTLREYQKLGFRWLRFMHEYGFSVCLADDMGLGKTVQTLALLQSLKDESKLRTSLLIVPVSALTNWEMEIQKFTPELTAVLHVGVKRDKGTKRWQKADLVITSYATLRQDIEIFKEFNFVYVILDESQNIKNASSQVSKATRLLQAGYRLALSGTPVENNTLELWSLFDFLIPGFLGSLNWFSRQFAQPVEREGDKDKAEILKKMVFPFILRRKKEDVETQLPDKTEILSRLEMNDEQLELYRQVAARYRKEVAKEIDSRGVGGSSVMILQALMRLRQVCLFPGLVHEDYQEIPSSKFLHFLELMEDILAEGHKVLIFSQFVQVLHRLREYFEREGVNYCYLDGSTRLDERGEMIRRFQEDEGTRAFLLSLKAGGTAITLTAADYVIIFDPWWNPAVEDQAIDRSHRIGQTKNVFVYRLIMEHSIEEKMLQLQQKKKDLADQLISTDGPGKKFKDLDKEEILELFE